MGKLIPERGKSKRGVFTAQGIQCSPVPNQSQFSVRATNGEHRATMERGVWASFDITCQNEAFLYVQREGRRTNLLMPKVVQFVSNDVWKQHTVVPETGIQDHLHNLSPILRDPRKNDLPTERLNGWFVEGRKRTHNRERKGRVGGAVKRVGYHPVIPQATLIKQVITVFVPHDGLRGTPPGENLSVETGRFEPTDLLTGR